MLATLRDGSQIEIRPIRPDDRDNVASGLDRLSPESVYRRFLAPMESLSDAELDYLTQVDHHDHEALVALVPETQEGLGVARFVREPDDPEVAEFAVAVADDWQGRGVGTALLRALSDRAREEGVRRFSALNRGADDRQRRGPEAALGSRGVGAALACRRDRRVCWGLEGRLYWDLALPKQNTTR